MYRISLTFQQPVQADPVVSCLEGLRELAFEDFLVVPPLAPTAVPSSMQAFPSLPFFPLRVVWRHVKAHTGRSNWKSRWNDEADAQAKKAAHGHLLFALS